MMTSMAGVMITDGGPHSAEKWAFTTGEMIIPIDPKAMGERLIAAKRVQLEVIEALESHHSSNMETERSRMSDDRLYEDYDVGAHVETAFEEICRIIKASPWAEKADDPRWRRIVEDILTSHFATARNIERQWHCLRSDTPKAKAWLESHHGAGN